MAVPDRFQRLKNHLRQGDPPSDELLEHLANSRDCFKGLVDTPVTRSGTRVRGGGTASEAGDVAELPVSDRARIFLEMVEEAVRNDLELDEPQ